MRERIFFKLFLPAFFNGGGGGGGAGSGGSSSGGVSGLRKHIRYRLLKKARGKRR